MSQSPSSKSTLMCPSKLPSSVIPRVFTRRPALVRSRISPAFLLRTRSLRTLRSLSRLTRTQLRSVLLRLFSGSMRRVISTRNRHKIHDCFAVKRDRSDITAMRHRPSSLIGIMIG
ncbi:hypothetical protein FOIG_00512 [Fusarium odoratissimum NRRL 54006]|uniref:Uncharacterized protein n=1 Tax=Fusarium odoratissimum (strain NRRL 54006) TaxID=1089451 RepID=X0LP76_FUSO5|nr:uncharacterized protein FOIG_00512 [Fusarium odoratissimum NRRL 54006]EXM10375.1 hypothetical protein FOIG_00512 [Fusarium odoratissimum NRRL 54006]